MVSAISEKADEIEQLDSDIKTLRNTSNTLLADIADLEKLNTDFNRLARLMEKMKSGPIFKRLFSSRNGNGDSKWTFNKNPLVAKLNRKESNEIDRSLVVRSCWVCDANPPKSAEECALFGKSVIIGLDFIFKPF